MTFCRIASRAAVILLAVSGTEVRSTGDGPPEIQALLEEGKFSEALRAYVKYLPRCTLARGTADPRTREVKVWICELEHIAALPDEQRVEIADAARHYYRGLELWQGKKPADAQPHLEKAVEVTRRILGEDAVSTLNAECYAGLNAECLGLHEEAERLEKKALELAVTTYGERSAFTASLCNSLGLCLQAQHKLVEAQPILVKAMRMAAAANGESHISVARGCHNLAANSYSLGKLAESTALSRKALSISRRTLRDEDPESADYYSDLAGCLLNQHAFAEAEPLCRTALELCLRHGTESQPRAATALHRLAVALAGQGKYGPAEAILRKLIHELLARNGEKHRSTLLNVHTLAYILALQDRKAEAAALLGRYIQLLPSAYLAAEAVEMGIQVANLFSQVLVRMGNLSEAEAIAQNALKACSHAPALSKSTFVSLHRSLGHAFLSQGKYDGAAAMYRKCIELSQEYGEEEDVPRESAERALAVTLYLQQDLQGAMSALEAAARSFERGRQRRNFNPLERTTMDSAESPFTLLAICLAMSNRPGEAWDTLERQFARALLDELAARWERPLSEAERATLRSAKRRLREAKEQLRAIHSENGSPLEHRALIQSLRDEQSAAETSVSQLEAELAAKYGPAAGQTRAISRVRRELAPDEALVAWVDLGRLDRKSCDSPSRREHWGFVARRDGPPRCVPLPGSGEGGAWTKDDDNLLNELRPALAQAGGCARTVELLERAYRQRIAPLEPCLPPTVKRLVVLPAGRMAGVPVEVLTDAYVVSYAPSGTMLSWLRERQKARREEAASKDLLLVGDAVFRRAERDAPELPLPARGAFLVQVMENLNGDRSGLETGDVLLEYGGAPLSSSSDINLAVKKLAGEKSGAGGTGIPVKLWRRGAVLEIRVQPGKLGVVTINSPPSEAIRKRPELEEILNDPRTERYAPLPGTRKEVEAIQRIFAAPPAHLARGHEPRSLALLGSEASEQQILELSRNARLRDYRYLHIATHAVVDNENPLRSALVLSTDALPNPREQAAEGKPFVDGLLSAEQILDGWDLDADLVTLSACETARGKAGGEGYLGFSQALFLAGARSLILSLWKVDDTATTLLMTRFYHHLFRERLPKAEALLRAKRWLRGLSSTEAREAAQELSLAGPSRGARDETDAPREIAGDKPYAAPCYWAGFILLGDSGE